RNAPASVEPIWSGDRACRTRFDATLACPATIRDRFILRQFQRREHLGEKEPRSEPLTDEHRTFAMPPDASLCGMIAFQHRTGIDVTFLLSAKAAKELVNFVQLLGDHIVVIVSPRVLRDSSCSHAAACRAGALRRPVGHPPLKIIYRQNNDRSRTRQNLLRIATFLLATLHVIHFAMRPVAQPFTKVIRVRRRVAGSHATRIKPDLPHKRDKPRLQFRSRNHDAVAGMGGPGLEFTLLSLARIATATSSSVSTDVSTRISAILA